MTMSATARAEVTRLIKQKEENVLKALAQEISIDTGAIERKMLQAMGYAKSTDDMREEKRKLENYMDRINKDDLPEYHSLDGQRDELVDRLNSEYEAMQVEQRRALDELQARQRLARDTFKTYKQTTLAEFDLQMTAIYHAAVDAEYPGTIMRLQEIEVQLPEVTKVERMIADEVERKAEAIESLRGRLQHLVRDAAANAQLELLKCKEPEDAYSVVNLIPTVAEVLSTIEDPEGGLGRLVERLNPSHQLAIAAPKFTVTNQSDDGKPVKVVMDDIEYEVVYADDDQTVNAE